MQQAVARGMQAAGENGGGSSMAFMGVGMQAAGNMMGAMNQPNTQPTYQPAFGQAGQQASVQQPTPSVAQNVSSTDDSTTKLLNAKKLLDAGAISQEEYNKLKAQVLGI